MSQPGKPSLLKRIIRRYKSEMHSNVKLKTYKHLQFLRGFMYKERRQLASKIPTSKYSFIIPEDQGFVKWEPKNLTLIDEVLSLSNKVYDDNIAAINKINRQLELGEIPPGFNTNPFLRLSIENHLTLDSPFLKLGLHPAVLKGVSDYLGMLPILTSISLLYSPNKKSFNLSSQHFHLDMHERKCAKIFMYIFDVDENCGPLTLISASGSEKIENKLRYKTHFVFNNGDRTSRVDDEVVEKIIDKNDIHVLTGKAGSIFLADTDRCFHYGSRGATKPRLALQFYYETPFSFGYPIDYSDKKYFSLSHLGTQTDSEIEKYALGK